METDREISKFKHERGGVDSALTESSCGMRKKTGSDTLH